LQGQEVYQYQFTYASDWLDMELLGNYHTSELYFVWDNPWPLRNNLTTFVHDFDDNDNEMASIFGNYWANMATYSNPNGGANGAGNSVEWPSVIKDAYSLDGMSHMAMKLPAEVQYALEDQICDYWDLFLGFTS
jgi:carboxylesterase type B